MFLAETASCMLKYASQIWSAAVTATLIWMIFYVIPNIPVENDGEEADGSAQHTRSRTPLDRTRGRDSLPEATEAADLLAPPETPARRLTSHRLEEEQETGSVWAQDLRPPHGHVATSFGSPSSPYQSPFVHTSFPGPFFSSNSAFGGEGSRESQFHGEAHAPNDALVFPQVTVDSQNAQWEANFAPVDADALALVAARNAPAEHGALIAGPAVTSAQLVRVGRRAKGPVPLQRCGAMLDVTKGV